MAAPGPITAVEGLMKMSGSSGSAFFCSAAWSLKFRPTQTIFDGITGARIRTPSCPISGPSVNEPKMSPSTSRQRPSRSAA